MPMSSQNQLLTLIANTEMNLQADKIRLADHQLYFVNFTKNHPSVFLLLLIPAFIAGWESGKNPRKWFGSFAKQGFYTMVTTVRKYYHL